MRRSENRFPELMPRIFDHVDLRVRDLKAAAPFYQALLPALGFKVRVEIPGWLQFESFEEKASEFFGVTEDVAHAANGSRIAFWAESTARVNELGALLRAIGAQNIEGPDWESETYYAVYFDDPSGNRLEVCHRTQSFTNTQ